MTIEQSGDTLKIRSGAADSEARTEVACNTMGKECNGTVGGDAVTVSYWYNGPALVEMAIEGKNRDRVTETRRRLSDDGQKMIVEIIPMSPLAGAVTKSCSCASSR